MKFWPLFLQLNWLVLYVTLFVCWHMNNSVRDLVMLGFLCITMQIFFLHEEKKDAE